MALRWLQIGRIVVSFIRYLLVDSAILLVFSLPLIYVARRNGRAALAQKFLKGGAIVTGVTALIAASSEHLVKQCFEAGNDVCMDVGSSGFRALLLGVYIVVALGEAYLIAND